MELMLRIKCGNFTLLIVGTSVRKRCILAQTMHNAKHIHVSTYRCFSGLVGPPKEDAPTESDRTQHNTTQTSLPTTSRALRLCALGICVRKSVERSCILLRLVYFTADLFHLTVYVCEINLYYEYFLTVYYFGSCRTSASWLSLYHDFNTMAEWGGGYVLI